MAISTALAPRSEYEHQRDAMDKYFAGERREAQRTLDTEKLRQLESSYDKARHALEAQFGLPIAVHADFLDALRYGLGSAVKATTSDPTQEPFDPNKIGALTMELSELVITWQAKHGGRWVQEGSFDGPEPATEEGRFWYHAYKRLRMHSKFESYNAWSRLKESV